MFLMFDPGQSGGQQSISVFLLEEKTNIYNENKVKNFLKVFKDNAGVILSC